MLVLDAQLLALFSVGACVGVNWSDIHISFNLSDGWAFLFVFRVPTDMFIYIRSLIAVGFIAWIMFATFD